MYVKDRRAAARNASTFSAANPFSNDGIFEGEVMLFVPTPTI
jgi:hypothetical protein